MIRICTLLILILFVSEINSQNLSDRAFIIDQTNTSQLKQIADDYRTTQNQFKNKKVPAILYDNLGNKQFFSHFDDKGNPLYFSLENESSAITSKIDLIRSGGSAGLDLDGSGLEIGL